MSLGFSSFTEFLHSLVTRGLERFGLFYGIYRGECIDNEDPEVLGRVKVSCPAVYGDDVPDLWAWPCAPAGNQSGMFNAPEPGDAVWVSFEMGNPRFPVVMGGWWGRRNGKSEVPFTARRKKPTNRVWKTKMGIRIEMDDADGKPCLMIYSPDGSFIKMDAYEQEMEERVTRNKRSQCGGVREETTAKDRIGYVGRHDEETIVGNAHSQVQGNRTESTLMNRMQVTEGAASHYVGQTKTDVVAGQHVEVALTGRMTQVGVGWNIMVAGPMSLECAGPLVVNSVGPTTVNSIGPTTLSSETAMTVAAPLINIDGVVVLINGVPVPYTTWQAGP